MKSPPKPLNEIKPNLLCELLTCMWRATFFFGWGPGEGSKGQVSLNYNVNLKDFYTNFVCFLTKHIRRDFHSVAWVMP